MAGFFTSFHFNFLLQSWAGITHPIYFQVEASVEEVAMDRLVEIPATANQVVAEEVVMEDRLAVHQDTDSLQVISWRLKKILC